MNEQVKEYIDKFPGEIIDMYNNLRQMIFDSALCEPEETLWAKIPSYYVGKSFVRLRICLHKLKTTQQGL